MTWWEVEQMTLYLNKVEKKLDEWTYSNPKMRIEQKQITRLSEKIEKALSSTGHVDKRDALVYLASRIQELQEYLTERLKREVTRNISPRNLLS